MEQEQTLYTLYKHKCKANNKVYIGLTNKSANERWRDGNGYKSNYDLYKDIREFGWEEGFEHEIIRDNLSYEEAKEAEIYLIKLYDATNSERGYNNRFGGSYGAFRRPSEIGAKIKNLRKENNETQLELSIAIGQERSTVACYESNRREPPLSVLMQIAQHYSVSLDYFGIASFNLNDDIFMKTVDYFKNATISTQDKVSLFNNILSCYVKYVVDEDV